MTSAFSGIKVIELGHVYNGPYCGLLFAQLGADVIKVEPPGGETLRRRSNLAEDTHEFVMLNSNKRSVTIDLKSEEGHRQFLELVRTADVLVENFAPGAMARLDLSPESLLDANPRLIVASGKGYGSTGPYAHMSAMDITVQAMSGAISSTGEPDGPPFKSGVAFVDFSGGTHLFAAIATALFQRERTGRGQLVQVSMHDTVYPMLASSLGGIYNHPDRELPDRTGNRHSGLAISPYNVYRTQDGWLALICMTERHWRGVAAAMGRPDLIEDPRFRTQHDRVANLDLVDETITQWTETITRDALVELLQVHGVPSAPVKTVREVAEDEHLVERGMIRFIDHPTRGRVPVPGCPLILSDSPVGDLTPAPALGASNDELLAGPTSGSESDTE